MRERYLIQLNRILIGSLTLSDVRSICLYIDVAYEDLPGDNVREKVQALVDHCQRQGKLGDLTRVVHQQMPNVSLPQELETIAELSQLSTKISALSTQLGELRVRVDWFAEELETLKSRQWAGPDGVAEGGAVDRKSTASRATKMLLQQINFDYLNSPAEHGWRMTEGGQDWSQPVFNPIMDAFVGRALQIRSTEPYAIDYEVGPDQQSGTHIEFVTRDLGNGAIAAGVDLRSDDGFESRRSCWLTFLPGDERPLPIEDGKQEWQIFVAPSWREGSWSIFEVDLHEAVARSFGQDGLSLHRLRSFRIRGDLSIAYLAIFE